jgi:addiction module RelB/DinJ family antitoxin
MTTTLQIRIDKKTKDAAQKAFHSMGLDMSSGVKLYLTQVMNTFPVFSFDNLPERKKLAIIKDAEWAMKHGKRYATIEEAHRDILGEK